METLQKVATVHFTSTP